MDKDVLETLLGRGLSLERIAARFGVHPSTVGYWVRKYGGAPASRRLVTVKLRHAPALAGGFTLTLANGRQIEAQRRLSQE